MVGAVVAPGALGAAAEPRIRWRATVPHRIPHPYSSQHSAEHAAQRAAHCRRPAHHGKPAASVRSTSPVGRQPRRSFVSFLLSGSLLSTPVASATASACRQRPVNLPSRTPAPPVVCLLSPFRVAPFMPVASATALAARTVVGRAPALDETSDSRPALATCGAFSVVDTPLGRPIHTCVVIASRRCPLEHLSNGAHQSH